MTEEPIKIGVLFSQSGPMAVTETAHLQGVLLAVDEINAVGGINGTLLETVVLDPKGDDAKYATMTTELLLKHGVSYIFGCCLSTSRKVVVPIVERYNGVLFYPSVYEGFEYSPNVIYGGAVPNQMVIPLLEHIYANYGKRVALVGSDTLYAREINRIVKEFLDGSDGIVVEESYLPFDCSEQQVKTVLSNLNEKQTNAILCTVIGESSVSLYNAHSDLGMDPSTIPIASLTTSESELAKMQSTARSGHLSVSPYFASLDSPRNQEFTTAFTARYGDGLIPGVYSEVCYSLIHIFANAIQLCEHPEVNCILSALAGSVFKGPRGDMFVDLETNHFTLRSLIGKSTAAGSFDIIFRASHMVSADPYLVAYDRSLPGRMTG